MPERGAVEKKYDLEGVVVRVDAKAQTATIRHHAIEGWMEAMTMEFPVPNKEEFQHLSRSRGQNIRAKVYVRDLDYHIGDVEVVPSR